MVTIWEGSESFLGSRKGACLRRSRIWELTSVCWNQMAVGRDEICTQGAAALPTLEAHPVPGATIPHVSSAFPQKIRSQWREEREWKGGTMKVTFPDISFWLIWKNHSLITKFLPLTLSRVCTCSLCVCSCFGTSISESVTLASPCGQ